MRILVMCVKEVRQVSLRAAMKVSRGAFAAFLRLLQMLFTTVTAACAFMYHRWPKGPCAKVPETEAILIIPA